MDDLTIIYLTVSNHPEKWRKYQQNVLIEASLGVEILTVYKGDINSYIGDSFIEDDGKRSHANMYWQLLKAAKSVQTEYIATAEDDVLYSREHFKDFRPPKDAVSYNMSRWSLFTWKPIYSLKQRVSNCTLIAPRKYLIEALEERFSKYSVETFPPELVSEVGRYEKNLGITERNMIKWYSEVPVIQLNHPNGTDSTEKRKKLGQIKAYDIPHWGKAVDIVNLYTEGGVDI